MKTSYSYKNWETSIIFTMSLSVFGLGIWLGQARMEHAVAQSEGELPDNIKWGFIGLNIGLFLISITLAYIAAHPKYDTAKIYNSLTKALKALERKLSAKIKELKRLVEKEQKEELKIITGFEESKEAIRNIPEDLQETIIENSNKYNYLNALNFEAAKQKENECEKHKQTFARKFIETCPSNNIPEALNEPIAKLIPDNEFSKPLYPFENQESEDEIIENSENLKNEETMEEEQKPSAKNNGKTIKYPLFLAIGMSTIISCQSPEPVATELALKIDVTPNNFNREILNAINILDLMDINEGSPQNIGTVTVGAINDISRNAEVSETLGEDNSHNPLVRKREIEKFANTVQAHIDNIYKSCNDYEQSKIYLSICEGLEKLSKSKADKKVFVIASDLLENSRHISFYEIFQNGVPEYGQITKKLEAQKSLPNLKGIHIVVIYSTSDPELDDLVRASQGYWQHLFESKGASVTFKANL